MVQPDAQRAADGWGPRPSPSAAAAAPAPPPDAAAFDEEEVTFLLRLRPSPSPPVARRKTSLGGCVGGGSRPSSGGWDVVIERHPTPPPPALSPLRPSAPPLSSGAAWACPVPCWAPPPPPHFSPPPPAPPPPSLLPSLLPSLPLQPPASAFHARPGAFAAALAAAEHRPPAARPPKPPPRPSRPSTPERRPASDVEERVRRLEADKESLQLQVAVLSEQIEVQTEKIADLEKALDEKKQQLSSAENMLQTEMLARSSLETHKLELLSGISELKLQQAAIERENLELRERLSEERRRNKPPMAPRSMLHTTSTPFSSPVQNAQLLVGASPSPSPVSSMSDGSPRRLGNEEIPLPRTPPANFRRKVDHYGSLPRQRTGSGSSMPPLDPNLLVNSSRKGVAFAETERVVIDDQPALEQESHTVNNFSPQPSPVLHPQKNKGIKKIFGRIKRSNSGTLEDLPGEGEFRRGGVRATAGPRLGWGTAPAPVPNPELPFAQWDSEAISQWLTNLGLECYANDARRWVKTGAQLLSASTHEIDKELSIKSPLHRKKLQLALLCETENDIVKPEDPHLMSSSQLDTAWVLRWLDDVGLPQHKESFLASRVDGRVLHRLTVDDLALLHLSSSLHVASLRRGIQVLRDYGFDPNCLLRRSLPEESCTPTPQDVARWTNHRVMEWLRVVDLAEYAPNLRGSGVHGGLMVHEPRFTAELLASLLSIPPSKTLLRRHLNTHFKELLGRECIQEKREAEATLGYVPLSATTKVKLAKKSQFTLKRKKSKAELDMGDLVCPLDPSKPGEGSPQTPPLHLHGDGMSPVSKAPKGGAASQGTDNSSLAESLTSDRTSTV